MGPPDPAGPDSAGPDPLGPDLAIILPTFNERGNLAPLIARIDAALGNANTESATDGAAWEVIIVDDHSPDGTAEEARTLARKDTRVRVIERIGRRGLASAVIEGFCATAARYVAVMDADHQHDPALLPVMLAALQSGEAEICIASRFAPGANTAAWDAPERERLSGLANRAARLLTGVDLTDPMSGYFMLETARARALAPRLSGVGFKILLDVLATADAPLRVKEVPLAFAARRAGRSKLDSGVAFDFLAGLYDKWLGRVIPTRFALFGTVGAIGVGVHMAVLAALFVAFGQGFALAQAIAVLAAMSFNFWLNNRLTYRDKRLVGAGAMLRGWAGFCGACAVGAAANVAVASMLEARGVFWALAALAGIVVGAVWNYALSSRFVWGRF
ncbi:MAG: glycosyltransferase family 2 protein [Erythrobacter sp.]